MTAEKPIEPRLFDYREHDILAKMEKRNHSLCEIIRQNEKALAASEAKIKELEGDVCYANSCWQASLYSQREIMKETDNKIAEKDKEIAELRMQRESLSIAYQEAANGIIEREKEIAILSSKSIHDDEELTSNSRDFWKAEAIRQKKENEDYMKFFNSESEHLFKCPICFKAGQEQALSDLINEIEEFPNPYPMDIFLWNNSDKLPFNRGRFNEFTHKEIENFRHDILQALKEKWEVKELGK